MSLFSYELLVVSYGLLGEDYRMKFKYISDYYTCI